MHPVTIENEFIRMEVWPQVGGKVSSIIDKTDNFELMFNVPGELPDAPYYDVPYNDHWYSGWDECFPAIAPSEYPRHPYEGTKVPDHGELWGIPVTTAVPTKDGITVIWHGLRFGYRLSRKLYLDGRSVVAEYQLSNLSPFEFRFVWAMHALLSPASPVVLDCGHQKSYRYSHDMGGNDMNMQFQWPNLVSGESLARPSELPPKRGWKAFSNDPISSAFQISYPQRNRSVKLEYSSEDGLPAYWGVWINTAPSPNSGTFAIEPTTGRFDQIDRAIKDGSAGQVGSFGKRMWSVRWTLAS
ncbi:MAG: hypothetical protein M3O30_04605 [Planctomycetota bacterium]|nr:hypothetical protein [Planctomycetota bacterium]